MTAPAGVRAYRWALRCYPRPFREEYGADMVALLEDQLRDESRVRVWARVLADFSLSVPARHLEVHMNRPPTFILPALFAGLSTAGILIVVIGGAGGATLAAGSVLAIGSAVLAFLAWRERRGIAPGEPAGRWWKFLGAGLAALAAFAIVTSATGEVSSGVWPLTMLALVGAIALIATGVILGVARLAAGRNH